MSADFKPYPAMKDSGCGVAGRGARALGGATELGTSVHGSMHQRDRGANHPNGREDLPCVRVADFDRARLRVRLAKPTLRSQARLARNVALLIEK